MGVGYIEAQAASHGSLTAEQLESLNVVRRVCDCFLATYRTYQARQGTSESETDAIDRLNDAFRRNRFNPVMASRMGLEAIIGRLNEEFGFNADPDLLEEHNATLHLIISDLQPTVTVL